MSPTKGIRLRPLGLFALFCCLELVLSGACGPCPPGFGVTEVCTDSKETQCTACPDMTYSAIYSDVGACVRCSHCQPGFYIMQACTAIQDTVCLSCDVTAHPVPDQCRQRNHVPVSPARVRYNQPLLSLVRRAVEDPSSNAQALDTGADYLDEVPYSGDEPDKDIYMNTPLELEQKTGNDIDTVYVTKYDDPDFLFAEPKTTVKTGDTRVSDDVGTMGLIHDDVSLCPCNTENGMGSKQDASLYSAVTVQAGESRGDGVSNLPVFAIAMSALTSGVVFFALGLFCRKQLDTRVQYQPTVLPSQYNHMPNKNGLARVDSDGRLSYPMSRARDRLGSQGSRGSSHIELRVIDSEGVHVDTADEETPMLSPPGETELVTGMHQSPIALVTAQAYHDPLLGRSPLMFDYIPAEMTFLKNNGHTIEITFDSECYIQGGPFGHTPYHLKNAQLHWGASSERGSEHTLDGITYAGELHLVHWNSHMYRNMEQAARRRDGLACVAVLLDEVPESRDAYGLSKVVEGTRRTAYKGQLTELTQVLSPADFLPSNTASYFTYSGSMTTSPFHETVTWVVMRDPVKVSKQQIRALRSLYGHEINDPPEDHCMLVDNCRELQPLEGRRVKKSFT